MDKFIPYYISDSITNNGNFCGYCHSKYPYKLTIVNSLYACDGCMRKMGLKIKNMRNKDFKIRFNSITQ